MVLPHRGAFGYPPAHNRKIAGVVPCEGHDQRFVPPGLQLATQGLGICGRIAFPEFNGAGVQGLEFGLELKDFALPAGEFLAFQWNVTGPRLKIFDHASSETGRFVGAAVPHLLNRVEKFFGDLLQTKDFTFLSGEILQGTLLVSAVLVVLLIVVTVIAAAFYNLFAELFGGVEITISEDETTL